MPTIDVPQSLLDAIDAHARAAENYEVGCRGLSWADNHGEALDGESMRTRNRMVEAILKWRPTGAEHKWIDLAEAVEVNLTRDPEHLTNEEALNIVGRWMRHGDESQDEYIRERGMSARDLIWEKGDQYAKEAKA